MTTLEKILNEFDEKFEEEFMLRGQKPSPKGTQRVWSTAYPMRQSIKSFITKVYHQARQEGEEEALNLLEAARCPDTDCDNNGTVLKDKSKN